MMRVVVPVLVGIAAVTLSASVALASETFWVTKLMVYCGKISGSPMDTAQRFGARPGASDHYDAQFDAQKPPEPYQFKGQPPQCYVYLYWYRKEWGKSLVFTADYRSAIVAGQTKVWQDLRFKSTVNGTKVISWALGANAATVPPAGYTFTIYHEGTTPNPTGGTPVDMRTSGVLSFAYAAGQVHYWHVAVTAK